jgi:hypothetical protein
MRARTRLRAGGYGGGAYGGGGGSGGGGGGSNVPNQPTANGIYELQVTGGAGSWLNTTPFAVASMTPSSSTYEVGQSIVNPIFNFTYANGSPASGTVTCADGAHSPYALASPYTSVTCDDTFTSTVNGHVSTFNVSATSTTGSTAAGSASFTYATAIVWGYSTAPAATQAQYNALLANYKELSTTRSGSYNFSTTTGTQYCMCAIPAAFGTPTVKDQNGFVYVPTLVGTANVNNAQGLSISTNFYVFGLEGAQATFTIS